MNTRRAPKILLSTLLLLSAVSIIGASYQNQLFVFAAPSVTLNPTSAHVGATVTVSGTGFAAGDAGSYPCLSGTPVNGAPTCTFTAGGVLTASFTVANQLTSGNPYAITATGSTTDSAAQTFNIIPPSVTLNPAIGQVGITVSVSGSGFFSSDSTCSLSGPPVTGSGSCSISNGVVTGSFTVFSQPPGPYTVTVTGNPGTDFGTATFTVTTMPLAISLNPSSGQVGSTVQVSGSGFSITDTTCTVTGPPVSGAGSCSISNGVVTGSFIVFDQSSGVYTVTVTGSPASDSAAVTFTILPPSITLNPSIGQVGIIVQFSGSGFYLGDGTCTVTGMPVSGSGSCSISSGLVSGSFTVASQPDGPYTVTVTGTGSDFATATFTITSQTKAISLNPSSAKVGATVSFSGSGFSSGDTTCTVSGPPVTGSGSCTISNGVVTGSFIVADHAPGTATVTVTGVQVSDTASATFTFLAPSITLTPASGVVGISVSFSGSGFYLAAVTCTVTGPPVSGVGSCSIASGVVSGSFTVANTAPGPYTVTVTPNTGTAATAQFTITTATITITLNPSSAQAGSTVSFSGSGFSPSDTTCSVTGPPVTGAGTCSVSNGAVTGSFVVFNQPAGPYTVTVTGNPLSDVGTATLTITAPTPTITLTPAFGPQGAVISVTGSGFSSGDTVASPYGCIASSPGLSIVAASSCSFTSNGMMTGTFTVTSGALLGGYIITATGASTDLASASFTVTSSTPTIVLSPSGGPTGTSVTVIASGFSPSDTSISFTTSPTGLFTGLLSCVPNNGACTGTFTVSASIAGGYIVTGTGTPAGDTASAAFSVGSVNSFVTFNPSSGPSGTLVSFSGAVNVNAASSCTVGGGSGSGLSIKSASCVIVGNPSYPSFFTGSFVVGNQNPGTYTVRITTSGGTKATVTVTSTTITTTGINFVEATFIVTGPKITLIPSSGRTGTTVTVSGVGFSFSDNTCTLSSTPSFVTNGQCTINGGTGVPSASFIVSNVAPGTYKLRVTGSTSDFAEAAFIVNSGPSVTLTPSSGAVGVTVTVTGVGFLPAGTSCSISGTPVRTPACTLVKGTGAPSGSFTISNVAPGPYVITLSSSGGDSAQAILTVTSISATLIFSLVQGGSAVSTVSPGATVYVRLGTGSLTSTATTCSLSSSPSGLFSSSVCHVANSGTDLTGTFFMVADNPSGNTYQVTVTDNIGSTAVGSIGIIFAPSLTLTPTYGSLGVVVSFVGRGLLSTDTSCTVTSAPFAATNGAQLQASPACSMSGGTATGTFVVSNLATADGSPWTVTVTGNPSSDAVTAQFTVVPALALSPANGVFGTVVTVTGRSFSSKAVSGGCTLSSTPTGLFASSGCNFIVPGPNGNGQLSGTFTVASGIPAGTYVVTASDGQGFSASATFTVGTPTAQVTVNPSAVTPAASGTVSVAVTGFGFNGVDTGCTVTVSSPISVSGTCTMSGGNAGATLSVPSNTPAGLYLVTITGTPNNDFASNYLAVNAITTATSTTSTTSVSTTATTTSTLTTFTSISSSLTTTTFTSTGPTTIIFTQGTQTTVSGVTTSTVISIGYTSFPVTQQTTTTETHTLGQIVGPSFNDLGIFGTLLLLVAVLWRRLFT